MSVVEMCWSCKNKFCSPVCLETHSDQCHVWRKRRRLEAAADAAVGAASEQAAVAAGCPAGAAPELAAAAEQAVGAADTAAAGAGGQASSPAVEQAALDAACEVVQEDGLCKVIQVHLADLSHRRPATAPAQLKHCAGHLQARLC